MKAANSKAVDRNNGGRRRRRRIVVVVSAAASRSLAILATGEDSDVDSP